MKEPLINLYVTKRFRVKGDKRLVELYKLKMKAESAFKAARVELMMENACMRA